MNPYEPPQSETLYPVTIPRPVWAFAGMFLSFSIAALCLTFFAVGLRAEWIYFLYSRKNPAFAARHDFATTLLILIAVGGIGACNGLAGRFFLRRDRLRALWSWGFAVLIGLAIFAGAMIVTIQERQTSQQVPSHDLGQLRRQGGGQ